MSDAPRLFTVVVTGTMRLKDYRFMERKLNAILARRLPGVRLLHRGGLVGVDRWCPVYAARRCDGGCQACPTRADAGETIEERDRARDHEMLDQADAMVVFDDGWAGCEFLLAEARGRGLPTQVVRVPPECC
jgi:hypothetical protein